MTVLTFSEFDLDPKLLRAIADKGYQVPTAIQLSAIPPALDNRNIIGSAPTGTGKTAAFLLPILQHLLDYPRKKAGPPRVLILTPTRELAMQIADEARQLASYTQLDITTITGGVSYVNHAEIFSTNQDIVVATPGRLLQYVKEENFDCRAVEILVLDEADRMLDMGFAQNMELLAAETRWRKQTLLFSATIEGELLRDFAERLIENPVYINAVSSRRERKKILQYYYRADNLEHKIALLCHLLKQPEITRAIVFVKKRERLYELLPQLQKAEISTAHLEGEMVQIRRTQAIERIKSGKASVLIATDVAARGIDIPDVDHIINFDLPRTADTYLHRIGRSARAGKKGTAISLVEAHDHELIAKFERYLDDTLKARTISSLPPQSKQPASSKKRKTDTDAAPKKEKDKEKKKVKVRHRDKKNIGKRRKPSQNNETIK